jgi:serine/threonine protein kinase
MALSRTQTTEPKTKLGRYELIRELTTSGVGTSWLARPTGETFEVTLLKIHRHMAKSPTSVESLLAAAQSARKFSHDNVASVLDAGTVDGEPFVVFEYVGESLATVLKAAGPTGLPIPIAMRISLDVLEGLAAGHTNDPPLGHGELGPWCVYVGTDGVARVGGLGVDQAVWKFGAHYVKNMERLAYAAPERVKAMSSTLGQELAVADEQSDLFSAAVLVFELLTKQRLFASKMEAAVVQKVLSSPIPTAQSFRNELPQEVSDALKQALTRDRSERTQTIEDFILAIEGAGPSLIATNEAVAEMIAVSATRIDTSRAAAGELLSSAGTPGAATKPAPVPGRATLMFDEAKDLLPPIGAKAPTPKPAIAIEKAADGTPASTDTASGALGGGALAGGAVAGGALAGGALAGGAVAGGAVAAGGSEASKPANGAAPPKARARTLMGFAAMRPAGSTTPAQPPVGPADKPIVADPVTRTSSVELSDADLDVQIEDPLALPTTVVELPLPGAPLVSGAAAPAPSAVAAEPQTTTKAPPPKRPPPARRAATLLGIQAPVAKPEAAVDISDEPTHQLLDEPTHQLLDEPKLEKAPTATTASDAMATTAEPAKSEPKSPEPPAAKPTDHGADAGAAEKPGAAPALGHASAKVAAMRSARDAGATPGRKKPLSAEMLRTGATLAVSGASYELIAPVARGGMATVWAAREAGSRGLEKMVGIKTMLPELSDDADFESMFLDEARVTAKIRHENVATIIDLGHEGELLYLVMEWVDGETVGTLQRTARTSGGIPTNVIVRIAEDICAGLHEAHELTDDAGHHLEVVHRDISPANVIVGRDGITKIVDFGIAKSKGRLHVTKVGAMVKGKTPYLSPEQIGGLAIDRRSDLFSLGALLYVMATGLHPFRGETDLSTIENIAIKAPVPLRSIVPDIDPGFEAIVLKLLEKDPKKRYQTAAEAKAALEELDKKLPSPASRKDVAAFVEKVIGDKLDQRRDMLVAGLEKIERQDRPTDAPPNDAAAAAEHAAESAAALGKVLERMRQSQPEALDAFSLGAKASLQAPAVPAFDEVPAQLEGAPSVKPAEAGDAASASTGAEVAEPAPTLQVFKEDSIAPPPAAQGNTKRLLLLVGAGLLIGLAIIGGLELFRSEAPKGSASAQPSATEPTPPAKASSGPVPTVTAPPTAVPSTEPTAAPTQPEPSSEPTTAPTTAPSTTPNTPPTSGPKVGAPPQPPPTQPKGPPPTQPKGPPAKPKPPKPKYNPATI